MGAAWTWQGHGMVRVNQTSQRCVNPMGKTQSKLSTAKHDRGRAWARQGHGLASVNQTRPR